eukprot:jgi/Mesvir1/27941/Mv20154-RA.2
MEIYNEGLYDLLQPFKANAARDPLDMMQRKATLEIRENADGSVFVPDLTTIRVTSASNVIALVNKGNKYRSVRQTEMNENSSRSHSILQLTIERRNASGVGVNRAKLNLVDLAGSERWADGNEMEDARINEMTSINQSLSSLTTVIASLAQKNRTHIPYRDSKLTHLLQDSLGGNCKTAIIATISPSALSFEETCSTLRFADRARSITTQAMSNVQASGVVAEGMLRKEVERLKGLLAFYAADEGGVGAVEQMERKMQQLQIENNRLKMDLAEARDRLKAERMQRKKLVAAMQAGATLGDRYALANTNNNNSGAESDDMSPPPPGGLRARTIGASLQGGPAMGRMKRLPSAGRSRPRKMESKGYGDEYDEASGGEVPYHGDIDPDLFATSFIQSIRANNNISPFAVTGTPKDKHEGGADGTPGAQPAGANGPTASPSTNSIMDSALERYRSILYNGAPGQKPPTRPVSAGKTQISFASLAPVSLQPAAGKGKPDTAGALIGNNSSRNLSPYASSSPSAKAGRSPMVDREGNGGAERDYGAAAAPEPRFPQVVPPPPLAVGGGMPVRMDQGWVTSPTTGGAESAPAHPPGEDPAGGALNNGAGRGFGRSSIVKANPAGWGRSAMKGGALPPTTSPPLGSTSGPPPIPPVRTAPSASPPPGTVTPSPPSEPHRAQVWPPRTSGSGATPEGATPSGKPLMPSGAGSWGRSTLSREGVAKSKEGEAGGPASGGSNTPAGGSWRQSPAPGGAPARAAATPPRSKNRQLSSAGSVNEYVEDEFETASSIVGRTPPESRERAPSITPSMEYVDDGFEDYDEDSGFEDYEEDDDDVR